ncbi:MAG: TAXI family TRAP transporter solute-binding subunit, partial [Pirellulales bacterium]|nr:TAXI family TRAP transporter solute-binding subunit [Pirellulales bacterium]
LLLALLTPVFLAGMMVFWQHHRNTMPDVVQIAGGLDGGVYNDVSQALAQRVEDDHAVQTHVIPSNGSIDNRQRLLAGQVDLAPMQGTAIIGDEICVVAPLFYEAIHVLARRDTSIQTVDDLHGHRVAVGPPGSGSRSTAELVFDSLGMTEDKVQREVIPWPELHKKDAPDAAIICIGRKSPLVSKLLASGRWRLVPIPSRIQISLQHPMLRPMTIGASEYSGIDLPEQGIATVGTTAFLAACQDTPSELVLAALEALYQEPPLCLGQISREHAEEWKGLAFHPAARAYFEQSAEE